MRKKFDLRQKFDSLMKDPTYSIFIYLAMCLIGLLIIYALLASFPAPKVKVPGFGNLTASKNLTLKVPSFGELLKPKEKPKLTITDILCSYLITWNQSNITFGNITCFKDLYGYKCVCIMPA